MNAIQKALSKAWKITPLLGGIAVVTSTTALANELNTATANYVHDITSGNDEGGSAAIVAATCEQIAPGSQNLVLSGLLR